MPDLTPIGNLVFNVLVGILIWTWILGPSATSKDATPVAQGVYITGVAFAFIAGLVALAITAIKLAA